jgi:hypothetical protein
MIEFLEKTYGERFKHVQGVRGHLLNDVYASMKVVVGDCIFAGTPRYFSDRVPETLGRHGLLVHPFVDGLEGPILVYEPQSLEGLHGIIETALGLPSSVRSGMIRNSVEYVQRHDTWTIRMKEILDEVYKTDLHKRSD